MASVSELVVDTLVAPSSLIAEKDLRAPETPKPVGIGEGVFTE